MAMINYADKVALSSNSGIADINKCTADDMNEIKRVVNENDTRLTTVENVFNGLESMGDVIVDKIESKNRFNKYGDLTYYIGYIGGSSTILENDKIKANANNADSNGCGQFIQLEPNTTYNYSFIIDSVEVSGNTKAYINAINADGTKGIALLSRDIMPATLNTKYSYSFTTGASGAIWVHFYGINNAQSPSTKKYVVYDEVQIEKGSTSTDNSEYINFDNTPKKLWVNPNPTLAFNAQTVNLSSTDFDMYEVVCKRLNSNSEMIVYKAFKNYICYMYYNAYATGTSQVLTNTRTATISGSTCIFSDANGNGITKNTNIIPICIIGYKTRLSI